MANSNPPSRLIRPGEYLFHENEPSRSIFIIKSGTVAIRKRRGNAYVELARAFANEVIGEVSFFDRKPRSASAVATTETQVLELSFDSLETIYASIPSYMRTIMAAMAERLRKADELVRKLKPETVNDRGQPQNGSDEPLDAAALLAATSDVLDGSASLGDVAAVEGFEELALEMSERVVPGESDE